MKHRHAPAAVAVTLAAILSKGAAIPQEAAQPFDVQEKTIAEVQQAIINREITTQEVVEAYLRRIQAYNGTCVDEPQGILGPITPIAHARQINALSTLTFGPPHAWHGSSTRARRAA
jgi:amidase